MYKSVVAGVALTALLVQAASGQTAERNGLVVRLEVGEVSTGLTASQLAFVYDSGQSMRADFLPPGWYTNAWNGLSLGVEDPNLTVVMREGRLHAVNEPTGRYVFSYDPNGLLESVSNESRQWRFEYEAGELVRIMLWRYGLKFGGLTVTYAQRNIYSAFADYMSYGLVHWTGLEWRLISARDPAVAQTFSSSAEARTSSVVPVIWIPPWTITPPSPPPVPEFRQCGQDGRYPIQGDFPAPPEYYYWIHDGIVSDDECRGRLHVVGHWELIKELGCTPGNTTGPAVDNYTVTVTATFGVGIGVGSSGTSLISGIETDSTISKSMEFSVSCCRVTRIEPPPPVTFQTCNRRWFQKVVSSALIWDKKIGTTWAPQEVIAKSVRCDCIVDVSRCDECDCATIR